MFSTETIVFLGSGVNQAMEDWGSLLLARYGNNPALTVILFTLDETAYARELAPLLQSVCPRVSRGEGRPSRVLAPDSSAGRSAP